MRLLFLTIIIFLAVLWAGFNISAPSITQSAEPTSPPPRFVVASSDGRWVFEGIELPTFPWAKTEWIADDRLAQATALAYRYSQDWRKVADIAAEKRVPIRWTDAINKQSGTVGRTLFGSKGAAIEIRADLRQESLATLAATIAHETYHAAYHQPCTGPTCTRLSIDEETGAFASEAAVYESIPDRFKGESPMDQGEKDIVNRWHQKKLLEYVISIKGYQTQFFGEELAAR